ncbi:MAG: hypothetical protein K0Q79_1042 [Flavipsychrobacter sp.]|jgi:hypothetical protein|nr:hypothetical protein [Flavipsychrobacter sp.]
MRILTTSKKIVLSAIFLLSLGLSANATVFTAVLSGNFNSSLTWGGVLPGSLVSSDIVIIPPGITVTLTADETFSGTSTLTVNGTLSSMGGALILTGGSLTGTGSISVDSLVIGGGSGITFTGGVTADVLTSLGAGLSSSAAVTVTDDLHLSSGTLSVTGGSLTLGSGAVIHRSGGSLTVGGSGSLGLTSSYSVDYTGAGSISAGAELTGSGLGGVTIGGGTITLTGGTTLHGTLTLSSGTLALGGYTLTLGSGADVAASGTGTITGSATSDLVISTGGSLTGALRFAGGAGGTLDDLTISIGGSGGTATLGTSLTLDGTLTLTSGSLSLGGYTLTLGAGADVAASGTGTLTGSATSDLVISTGGSLSGALRFSGGAGATIDDLTIGIGGGGTASLGTDLTLDGTLTLTSGSLSIGTHTLTLGAGADVAASGSGTLTGSATSDLVISTGGSLSGALRFGAGAGATLDDVTISIGGGGTAILGSDLMLDGTLTLTSGSLALGGYSLTLGGGADVAATGTGTLTGSATSDLTIAAGGSLTGALRFSGGAGAMLDDLTLSLGSSSGSVTLGSGLTVDGTLNLNSGRLKLGVNDLTVATGATVTGGSSASFVMTDGTGDLVLPIIAGAIDTFEVGTTTHYAPMVVIGGTGSAAGNVSVNVQPGVLSAGTTGTLISTTARVVDATWHVSSTATGGINYTLVAMWDATMELNSFNRASAYLSHYTSGSWDATALSAAGTSGSMYTMTRAGITSLSPFMVTDGTTPTNINNVVAANDVIIYPNPVAGTLNFSTATPVDNICIFDICGRQVKNVTGATAVSVAELPAGTYMVRFTGEHINATKKIVKE